MCLGRSHIEKNQKNAPWNSCRDGFFAVEPKQPERKQTQLNTSCLWYCIKCQTRGVPEVICAQRHTTNCTSRHNSKWLLDLPPNHPPPHPVQTIPQMCARLVWVPGYLFRSELLVHNFSQRKLFSFCWLGLPFFSRERHNHTFRLTTYNCNVLTDFQHTKFFPFQSLGFIIKIFLKYS